MVQCAPKHYTRRDHAVKGKYVWVTVADASAEDFSKWMPGNCRTSALQELWICQKCKLCIEFCVYFYLNQADQLYFWKDFLLSTKTFSSCLLNMKSAWTWWSWIPIFYYTSLKSLVPPRVTNQPSISMVSVPISHYV